MCRIHRLLEQDSLEIQYILALEHVDRRRAEEDGKGNGIPAGLLALVLHTAKQKPKAPVHKNWVQC